MLHIPQIEYRVAAASACGCLTLRQCRSSRLPLAWAGDLPLPPGSGKCAPCFATAHKRASAPGVALCKPGNKTCFLQRPCGFSGAQGMRDVLGERVTVQARQAQCVSPLPEQAKKKLKKEIGVRRHHGGSDFLFGQVRPAAQP